MCISTWDGGSDGEEEQKACAQQAYRPLHQEMSRGQYVALCVFGAVSVLAYVEAFNVGRKLQKLTGVGASGSGKLVV